MTSEILDSAPRRNGEHWNHKKEVDWDQINPLRVERVIDAISPCQIAKEQFHVRLAEIR
jgi:hypothetical protein